jgi:hypothetical protein
MDATLLGVVLDSSVPIAAERRKLPPAQAVESVQCNVGEVPTVLSALTVRGAKKSRSSGRRIFAKGLPFFPNIRIPVGTRLLHHSRL